jgi:spermidine synthase
MRVVTDPARPTGRTLLLDRVHHAYVDLEDPTHLQFRYERWYAAATADLIAAERPLDVLHVGGGGFTFPRYLQATDPGSQHTVLELDPEVVDEATRRLALDPSTLDVRIGDARTAMRQLPDDAFDLAVGDAFSGLSVPWHLTTSELLVEIDRTLRPDGRYVMNLIDGPALRFARAETATLRSMWEHVAVIAPLSALAGAGGSNVVLVAAHAPIDTDALRGRLAAAGDTTARVLAAGPELDAFTAGSTVLRDDFAPVDQLLVR